MAIVYALCAAYVAYCLATNPAGPFTTPDSLHYLNTSAIVPLGYPFFLTLTGARGAIVIQPLLFGAALAFLGHQTVRLARSTWLAAAIVVCTMALPQLREFHASILSESLFLTLLMVFLGLALRFSSQPSWHLMVLIATAVGLATTVRRTGFALLPVMLFMVTLARHRLRGSPPALLLVAALAPFVVIIAAEQVVAPLVHSGGSSSLMGRHMFAKAALIDAPASASSGDPLRDTLNQHLEDTYAPIRATLRQAPRDLRGVLTLYYETCLQGGCVDQSRALMPGMNEAEQTRILGAVGMERIRRAPLAFLDLVALNYQALWTVDRLRHPGRAGALTAFIAAHRPLPYEQMALSLTPEDAMAFRPSPRVRYMQLVITALAIFTGAVALYGLILLTRPRPITPARAIATIAALSAHGGLLLTAGLAAGFSRFMQGLWPAIVVAALFGVWAMIAPARAAASAATAR